MRILLKVSVAASLRQGKPLTEDVDSLGADFNRGWRAKLDFESGNPREEQRLSPREKLGVGRELGGGEIAWAGPAQSSEPEPPVVKLAAPSGAALRFIRVALLFLLLFGVCGVWEADLASERPSTATDILLELDEGEKEPR